MTQEQIDQIKADIELAASAATALAGVFAPGVTAWIVIGKAVAKQMPELVAIVEKWIAGEKPTAEEIAIVQAQLKVLQDPNLP